MITIYIKMHIDFSNRDGDMEAKVTDMEAKYNIYMLF